MSNSPFAPRLGGGDYIKAAEHVNDLAILLEPKKILKDQPNEYEGVQTLRDVAIADVSFFRNSEDIENQTPSLVKEGAYITGAVLVKDIEESDWIGKAALVVIQKPKKAYVWREPTYAGAEAAVAAYLEKRDADIAANLDDFPEG